MPKRLQKANWTTFGVRPVMLTHDGSNGFRRFIGVIEWDGRNVVM